MALHACPDCGGKVSSSAPACPHCGATAGGKDLPGLAALDPLPGKILIERTAKIFKAQLVLAALLVGAGVTCYMAGSPIGGSLIGAIGLIWFIAVRIIIWWEHE